MSSTSLAHLSEALLHYFEMDAGFVTEVLYAEPNDFGVKVAIDDRLSIVSMSAPEDLNGAFYVDVHAGGAYRVPSTESVIRTLVTSSWRFDLGGLWCRLPSPGLATPSLGTLNFGWRTRLPSELFSREDLELSIGFLSGLVILLGGHGRTLAEVVEVEESGGTPIRPGDDDAWAALVGGLLPPT